MQLVSLFCAFWILLFFVLLFKKNVNKSFLFIVGIWAFSSATSIIYVSEIGHYDRIQIIPYIFLILCLMASFQPYMIPNDKIRSISIGNDRLFEKMILYLGVISILPFCENLIHLMSSYGSANTNSLADIYEEKMSGDFDRAKFVNWFSFPGKVFNSINLKFQYCSLFLLFLYMCRDKISRRLFGLMLIVVLNPVLYQLNMSGRSTVVFNLLRAGLLYFMFNSFLNSNIKRTFLKYGLIILVFSVVLLMILTIARYSTNEGASQISLLAWMSLYSGEGTVNFNNYMWNTNCFTEGDTCFSFIKSILGFDTFDDVFGRRDYWGPRMGINPVRFYTFVGDLFADLGYFCLFFLFIIGYGIKSIIVKSNPISAIKMYVFYTWAYLCISGITIFTFKTINSSIDLVTSLVIVYLIDRKSKNCIVLQNNTDY